mmetsp:Transcript_26492/g.40825  ORF Transcript_26492/g.40825 Transcript_26492/m.40825 type:complete len:682 (+) Transcript_26492:40-2085(+)
MNWWSSEFASRHLPTFLLFLLVLGSTIATVLVFSSSIHSLRTSYQTDMSTVNNELRTIQSQQSSYQQQIATLTKLVTQSLNATDEYISNITSTLNKTETTISQDMATVHDIQDSQNTAMAVQFAGMFTILVILVSGYHLSQHIRHMHSPVVQRKIMAVLWMTPIYSVSSWVSLVSTSAEPYLAVIREFYESYTVYTFLSFLISVLGRGDRWKVVELLAGRADRLPEPDRCRLIVCKKNRKLMGGGYGVPLQPNDLSFVVEEQQQSSSLPLSVSPAAAAASPTAALSAASSSNNNNNNIERGQSTTTPRGNDYSINHNNNNNNNGAMISAPAPRSSPTAEDINHIPTPARLKAEAILDQCQMYAMQFVLLRPLTAIGWLVSNQLFVPDSFLDWTKPQIYITIVTNGSIFFAFRGLVRFYHATREDLEWVNPWPKFLAIKGVVFMTFWQRMVISLIVNLGYADKFPTQEKATEFIMQAQNFLICLEMLFSAVAHCFIFSPDEWAPGYREREEARQKMMNENGTTAGFGDSVALGDFINDIKVVMASKARRKRRKKRMRQQQGAMMSPSSTKSGEEEEEDEQTGGLELSSHPSTSSFGDEDQLNTTVDSIELGDDDADWSADVRYDEHTERLADAPLGDVRRRLDTGSSAGSDGGDNVYGSWSRIETFIEKHASPLQDSHQEIV